jgi:hypothetical protein
LGVGNEEALYAEYRHVVGGKGVLPPPGNPAAVPAQRANELLAQAVDAMRAGTWRVQVSVEPSGPHQKPTDSEAFYPGTISGLIRGRDFDLVFQSTDGRVVRTIGVNDKVWGSDDGGRAWNEITYGLPDSRGDYYVAHAPLGDDMTTPLYEMAGGFGSEAELAIQASRESGFTPWGNVLYTLALDKSKIPVLVKECAWTNTRVPYPNGEFHTIFYRETFTPAKAGEEIKPPEAAK